jgi:hypothetical protein
LDDHKNQIYMESIYVKLLPNLILIGACCWAASAQALVPCTGANCGPHTSPPPAPPPAPAQGTTPAQIAADFPAYIIWQFQNAGAGGMEQTITGMTDKELYLLASFFIQNGGYQPTLMQIAAQSLSARNLVRWQAAFTQAVVSPYVGAYAPAPISTTYFAHPGLHAAVRGVPPSPPTPPDPFATYNTPIEQMYLEYRTAPFSNCGSLCAMGKVLAAISGQLALSWKVGTAIGTTFYNAMTSIDPSYGYDLVVGGGNVMWEQNGMPMPPPGGAGVVENPDGTWFDANGNPIPNPNPTQYGIPGDPNYYPPYTIYDPFGDCLIGLLC